MKSQKSPKHTLKKDWKNAPGTVEVDLEDVSQSSTKVRVSIMLDADIIAFFKDAAARKSDRYQSLINRTLREAMMLNVVYGEPRSELEDQVRAIVQDELKKRA